MNEDQIPWALARWVDGSLNPKVAYVEQPVGLFRPAGWRTLGRLQVISLVQQCDFFRHLQFPLG